MSIEQQFIAAQAKVKTLTSKPSNDVLLNLYSLYKQAADGDVSGPKPGMFDMVGGAKYSAWKKLSGTTKEDAMKKYIEQVEALF